MHINIVEKNIIISNLFLDTACAFSTKGRASSHLSLMQSKQTLNVFDIFPDSLPQILHPGILMKQQGFS